MVIAHPTNLAATLDSTAEAFFYERPIPTQMRDEIASLIASRQIQSGAKAGFFLPFAAETETTSHLFSGEELHTSFAENHFLLIEAARILKLLAQDNHAMPHHIQAANNRMEKMCYSKFCAKGECKTLTIAYLRYLAADKSQDSQPAINPLLTQLSEYRDGKGKWRGFPFFYTLLMLTELSDSQSSQELQYSAPICEKHQKQSWPADPHSNRRQEIITRAQSRS
jgi:hypothetical protein